MAKRKELYIKEEHTLDDLTSVSKTIIPLAKQLLGTGGMLEIELLSAWKSIVGDTLAPYTLPRRIRFARNEHLNGTLDLFVLGGAFALEIQQRESQILEKINTYFGYQAVSKLKIIQNNSPEDFLLSPKPIDNMKKNLVSQEEQNYITEIVKEVADNNLRYRLENLGRAVFGNKKS
ncbi:MAG: DciA family protein [Pseudomonadota bacterium]|nr:DciA family protein [Pseudomonadota bacterium]